VCARHFSEFDGLPIHAAEIPHSAERPYDIFDETFDEKFDETFDEKLGLDACPAVRRVTGHPRR
jgi:hypothetical protein